MHSTAGYLLYAMITHQYAFDCHVGDKFGCVADIGWITGHSYAVYAPLANGVTSLLFESTPVYPNPGRYWEMVERLRLTHFYGAPTAIRLLIKYGSEWVQKYDRSTLRVLGSVGEPINVEAWEWYKSVVGDDRCTVVDTWWQTETGGIALSPRPRAKRSHRTSNCNETVFWNEAQVNDRRVECFGRSFMFGKSMAWTCHKHLGSSGKI